jgi:hypothetical protein
MSVRPGHLEISKDGGVSALSRVERTATGGWGMETYIMLTKLMDEGRKTLAPGARWTS